MVNRIGGDFLREKNFFYKRKTESGGTVVGKRGEKETDFCAKESIVMIVRDITAFVIVEMAFDGIKAPYQKQ